MSQGSEALHPGTLPRDEFPSLHEPREPRVLTPEDLEREAQHFAENQAASAARQKTRERNTGIGESALNWADTALFDSPDQSVDPKTQRELQRAQNAFTVLMLLFRDITDNAPIHPTGLTSFFELLAHQVNQELESRGWQSLPLNVQK